MDYEIETLGEGEISIRMEETEILKRFIVPGYSREGEMSDSRDPGREVLKAVERLQGCTAREDEVCAVNLVIVSSRGQVTRRDQ